MNREQKEFLKNLLAEFRTKSYALAEASPNAPAFINSISRGLERLLEKEPRKVL